jgi:hypothetical protein
MPPVQIRNTPNTKLHVHVTLIAPKMTELAPVHTFIDVIINQKEVELSESAKYFLNISYKNQRHKNY